MRRKPRSAARSSAAPTRGCATPLNAASAQPKPSPSHSMRATLAILALASGSLVPRPTTTSSDSARSAAGATAAMRSAAASSSFGSIAEIAAEPHLGPRMRGHKAVHLPRQIVLDVARGEQHARHGQDFLAAPRGPQPGQRLADRRAGEFEIAGREIAAGEPGAQRSGGLLEFRDRLGVAAAVAAQQHRRFVHHRIAPAIAIDRRPRAAEIAAAMMPPSLDDPLLLLLAGLAFDALFGDMPMVFRFLPHPVVLAGRAIGFSNASSTGRRAPSEPAASAAS